MAECQHCHENKPTAAFPSGSEICESCYGNTDRDHISFGSWRVHRDEVSSRAAEILFLSVSFALLKNQPAHSPEPTAQQRAYHTIGQALVAVIDAEGMDAAREAFERHHADVMGGRDE